MASEGENAADYQIQIETRQMSSKASELRPIRMSSFVMTPKFDNYVFNVNLCVSLRRPPPTALRR